MPNLKKGGTDNLEITSLRLVALHKFTQHQHLILSFKNPVRQGGIYTYRNRKLLAEVGYEPDNLHCPHGIACLFIQC